MWMEGNDWFLIHSRWTLKWHHYKLNRLKKAYYVLAQAPGPISTLLKFFNNTTAMPGMVSDAKIWTKSLQVPGVKNHQRKK